MKARRLLVSPDRSKSVPRHALDGRLRRPTAIVCVLVCAQATMFCGLTAQKSPMAPPPPDQVQQFVDTNTTALQNGTIDPNLAGGLADAYNLWINLQVPNGQGDLLTQ